MKVKVEDVLKRLHEHILGFDTYINLAKESRDKIFGVNKITTYEKLEKDQRDTMKFWEGYIAGVENCKQDLENLEQKYKFDIRRHKEWKEYKKYLKQERKELKRKKEQ